MPKITLIAALNQRRVIGDDGTIPWDLPGDRKLFYNETFGHPVILGRKTFENICEKSDGPLDGRLNIVMSESESYDQPMVVTARNKQAAIEAAKDTFEDEVFVAGGESIYRQFIDDADRMLLTWVKKYVHGNAYFPKFDLNEWKTGEQRITNNYTVIDYERR